MKKLILGILILVFQGCDLTNDDNNSNNTPSTVKVDVNLTTDSNLEAGFAEFTDANCANDGCNILSEFRVMPTGFTEGSQGYYLQSNNHSDDLFMFVKRRVDGLAANAAYNVKLSVSIATPMCNGMVGIGGAPGESNYVKLGVSKEEPLVQSDELHTMNIEKGNQSNSGGVLEMVGNLGAECSDTLWEKYTNGYFPKTLSSETGIDVVSDENGQAWIIVGNDSGFEGITQVYIEHISAIFTKK